MKITEVKTSDVEVEDKMAAIDDVADYSDDLRRLIAHNDVTDSLFGIIDAIPTKLDSSLLADKATPTQKARIQKIVDNYLAKQAGEFAKVIDRIKVIQDDILGSVKAIKNYYQ